MKTLQIARGIAAVLSLAGVTGLVGCGAETGEPEAQIGSTSEALSSVLTSTNDPTDLSTSSPDMRKSFASACVLSHTALENGVNVTRDYLIRAGGFDATPAAKNTIEILTKGSAPSLQAATLSQANGSGQMVKVSADACLYLGGADADNTGTAYKKADLLTLSFPGGVPTISVTAKTDFTDARSNFVAGTCTDGSGNLHAWVLGGQDSVAGVRSLEISNAAFSAWTKTTAVLSTDRQNFGADIDVTGIETNRLHIVAGGGFNVGGASRDQTLDLIKLDSADCSYVSKAVANTANLMLPSAADGNAVFFDTSVNKFVSALGAVNGTTLETKVRTYTINWATPAITSVSDVTSPTGFTAAFRPYVARQNSTDLAFIGGSNAAINTAIASVQEYESGTWDSKATTSSVGMFGAVGGWLPNTGSVELWAVNGESDPSPYTLSALVDAWND